MQVNETMLVLKLLLLELIISKTIQDQIDVFIEQINAAQTTWKAHRSAGMGVCKQSKVSMIENDDYWMDTLELPLKNVSTNFEKEILPEEFDARGHWANCTSIGTVWNQGACSSCWAISTANMITDRICIRSMGQIQVNLSAEHLLSCCSNCSILSGCQGGDPRSALQYFNNHGLVSGGEYESAQGCQPYSLPPCRVTSEGLLPPCENETYSTPICHHNCTNHLYYKSFTEDIYKAKYPPYKVKPTALDIKSEIYQNGPTIAVFLAHEDFTYYKSGIYQVSNQTRALTWHSTKLIGWGLDNNEPYWLAINSWGSDWGENGTFRIRLGYNECDFENHVLAVIPHTKTSLN